MKKVEIFTDGACSGNPGPGGWGAILRYNGHEKRISGGAPDTTNNRMELTGVIEALKLLKEPCDVVLTSDSRYVCDAVGKGWAEGWKRNGWRKADKKPALNSDLWETMLELLTVHRVAIKWIKGHAGFAENELCDRMAVAESQKFKSRKI